MLIGFLIIYKIYQAILCKVNFQSIFTTFSTHVIWDPERVVRVLQ